MTRNPGLLRLRALRDTSHNGQSVRAGDVLTVTPAEAERLLPWGAFELTEQARVRLQGFDPWARVVTR